MNVQVRAQATGSQAATKLGLADIDLHLGPPNWEALYPFLEQRWIEEQTKVSGETINWRGENRIRYMLRTSIPLTQDKKTYLSLWDEVFFNFGGNVKKNNFDQTSK